MAAPAANNAREGSRVGNTSGFLEFIGGMVGSIIGNTMAAADDKAEEEELKRRLEEMQPGIKMWRTMFLLTLLLLGGLVAAYKFYLFSIPEKAWIGLWIGSGAFIIFTLFMLNRHANEAEPLMLALEQIRMNRKIKRDLWSAGGSLIGVGIVASLEGLFK